MKGEGKKNRIFIFGSPFGHPSVRVRNAFGIVSMNERKENDYETGGLTEKSTQECKNQEGEQTLYHGCKRGLKPRQDGFSEILTILRHSGTKIALFCAHLQ